MRLLLDECVPARLARALDGHEVRTVVQMGWSGVKNGQLLALAGGDFDALITVDQNLRYQRHEASLPLVVIVLEAHSNQLTALLRLVPELQATLAELGPRRFLRIPSAR
ncbi:MULTISPECIES: DUF5615 family PIN-like protein [unclassified Roseateles]|uniref:DUF5615 family PIN-like protein n=1 Tax=unclassified Roseateles TaxID=2626991 RepID=UPI000700AADC|nr:MULTISPECIES: DUF5615 family PIN-like protein [unclassified Roseateles]KQW44614.1 hypothetical protein ASC81_13530 [Pelomonas sp. Root405]KRA69973.1 hypothetical protein ASD88_17690 [Pelomonas sp. Root662]